MTRAVLEAENEGEARNVAAAVLYSALAVPASLHASLMARLDRLGQAKEVAQIGAAIGREFAISLRSVRKGSNRGPGVKAPETALVSHEDCFMVGTKSGEGRPSWPRSRHSMFPN
jgi:hypothetical protein